MNPTRRAVDAIRRLDNADAADIDLILFDFSDPSERNLQLAIDVACGPMRTRRPVAFLTTRESELLLESRELECCDMTSFAPIMLHDFVHKMNMHSEQRFLRALALLYELGPILVRLPEEVSAANADYAQLTA